MYPENEKLYTELNQYFLRKVRTVLPKWLPGGDFTEGEYCTTHPRSKDGDQGSLCVNTTTGAWEDYEQKEQGKDLISLYAYLKDIKISEAAGTLYEMSRLS